MLPKLSVFRPLSPSGTVPTAPWASPSLPETPNRVSRFPASSAAAGRIAVIRQNASTNAKIFFIVVTLLFGFVLPQQSGIHIFYYTHRV